MRDFAYRTPRFLASAPFLFRIDDTCVPGVCTNVSSGGVSALMGEQTLKVGGAGSLVLSYLQHRFTLGAFVSHVEGQEVGFSFVQRNEEERSAAADFEAFLAEQAPVCFGHNPSDLAPIHGF
jgi:hypothetical protein